MKLVIAYLKVLILPHTVLFFSFPFVAHFHDFDERQKSSIYRPSAAYRVTPKT